MNLLLGIFLIMLIPVVLIFMVFSFLGMNSLKKVKQRQKEIEHLLKSNDFLYSQIFTDDDKKSGMVYDGKNKLGIFELKNNNWNFEEIEVKEILQSEIVEDGLSIMKTSKRDVILGAALGSIFGSGLGGAIVGGVAGKKTNIDEIKKLQLQIIVNDVNNPIKKVNFIDKNYFIKKTNHNYTLYFDKIKHWHKLIEVLIENSEKENKTVI